jgi:hypothetical protein
VGTIFTGGSGEIKELQKDSGSIEEVMGWGRSRKKKWEKEVGKRSGKKKWEKEVGKRRERCDGNK